MTKFRLITYKNELIGNPLGPPEGGNFSPVAAGWF